jgi:iron complex outermembrane receptor protein
MPDSQDPLGLTRVQYEADPTSVAPAALEFNTRKSTRQATLGGSTDTRLADKATLNASAWVGTRSVTQFQAIPVAAQLNPRHPGGVVDFDRVFGGADVRVIWALGIDLTL